MKADGKYLHSIRISNQNWENESRLVQILELLKKHPGGIGQVALFTAFTHTPLSLTELERRCGVMEKRMRLIRSYGLSAGINILGTVGHHNEDLGRCFSGPYERMTDIEGNSLQGCFCLRDENYKRDYVRPAYRLLADTHPDFIWIDDDIRYRHGTLTGGGCFCQSCIKKFNMLQGTDFTRETLRDRFNSGDVALRRTWLSFQTRGVTGLLSCIGQAVRGKDASVLLGIMTGERYFEGYDFAAWADALSENGKYPVMFRPGGGAYTDYNLRDICGKADDIGRQNVYLPDSVCISQSEIENFPYQLLKKTPLTTATEAALYMASGCTGAAFNILPSETLEDLRISEPYLAAIDAIYPFCRLLKEKLSGARNTGLHTGWRRDGAVALAGQEWTVSFGSEFSSYMPELFDMGIPECYSFDGACVTCLKSGIVNAMSDEDIRRTLQGGVMLDAGALILLNRRGFGDLTGFAVGKEFPVDATERYLPHVLNEGFVGGMRNCRQAFNTGDSYGLIPTQNGAASLSELIDYGNQVLSPCASGIFENADGGRIFVAGYFPFSWISDSQKTLQYKRILCYLSKNSLPTFVGSYTRVRNFTLKKEGKLYSVLFNPTNMPLSCLDIFVNTKKDSAVLYRTDGSGHTLPVNAAFGGYRRVTVPSLAPTELVLLEF